MRLYELLEDMNQVPKFYDEMKDEKWREDNDCSIVSISLACNISYETARDALMKNGKNKDEGVTFAMLEKTLKDLGYDYRKVETRYYHNMVEKKVSEEVLTVLDIINNPEVFSDIKRQLYYVSDGFNPHVLAMINGKMQDNMASIIVDEDDEDNRRYDWDDEKDEEIVIITHPASQWSVDGILDVFKIGNKPNITDNALWNTNPKNVITNYNEFIPYFINYWNSRASDDTKIDENTAWRMIEHEYDNLQRYKWTYFRIKPNDNFDKCSFNIERDENWNLSITKTNDKKSIPVKTMVNNYDEVIQHIIKIYNKYACNVMKIDAEKANSILTGVFIPSDRRFTYNGVDAFWTYVERRSPPYDIDTRIVITNNNGNIDAVIERRNAYYDRNGDYIEEEYRSAEEFDNENR